MPFALSRTDTGQFVLQDPRTDVVVIDDDLVTALEKIEAVVAESPAGAQPVTGASQPGQASSAFGFAGGPRYAGVLLAVVLPFVWLAALYFALANLLAEQSAGRGEMRALEERVESLEGEVQALRSAAASAPRMAKSKPKRHGKGKSAAEARAQTDAEKAAGDGAEKDGEAGAKTDGPPPAVELERVDRVERGTKTDGDSKEAPSP